MKFSILLVFAAVLFSNQSFARGGTTPYGIGKIQNKPLELVGYDRNGKPLYGPGKNAACLEAQNNAKTLIPAGCTFHSFTNRGVCEQSWYYGGVVIRANYVCPDQERTHCSAGTKCW